MENTNESPESGWRGSADVWLEAAYEALISKGVDSVKIMPLANHLKLSRTSFYWFFKDRNALLDALVARWRNKNTGNLVARAAAFAPDIAEAALNLFDCWLDQNLFDARFEFAIRNWAQQSTAIADEIASADETRLAALTNMFIRFNFAPADANIRARTIYLTQIGYISMRTDEAIAIRMARIPFYIEVFTGSRASPEALARFHDRHTFSPPTL